jgi:hypothetical protein
MGGRSKDECYESNDNEELDSGEDLPTGAVREHVGRIVFAWSSRVPI